MNNKEYMKNLQKEYDLICLNKNPYQTIYIDDFIKYKTIKPLLEYGELNELIAPTGAGKTYSVMEAIKELSKENPTICYIMACPNRVQNIQNKKYEVNVVIGGKEREHNLKTVSMVYDLAENTINQCKIEGREVVLVIDEAHQLIDAYDYRKTAIKGLLKCIKHHTVKRTLFITATPQKISSKLGLFDYDYVYTIKHQNSLKSNNVHKLKVIRAKNKDNALIDIITENKKKNIISVVELNDIEWHSFYELLLLKHGFKVTSLHSKNKGMVYDSITEDEIIPDGIDVLLTTSVLECGTNINNTNVSLIAIPNSFLTFDLDSLEQFYARARKYNEEFYLILEELSNKNKIKVREFKKLDYLVEEFGKEVVEQVKDMNNMINSISNTNFKKEVISTLTKGNESDRKAINKGCIIYNEDAEVFTADQYLFTKQIFKMYYSQFYFDTPRLKFELDKRIKADKIECELYEDNISKETIEEMKAMKKDKKKSKEQQKQDIKELLKEKLENEEEREEFLSDLKEYFNDSSFLNYSRYKEEIKDMILEKTTPMFIKRLLDINHPFEESVKMVAYRKTDVEIKDKICELSYTSLNKNSENIIVPKAERVEYMKVRNILDPVREGSSRRLTDEIKYQLALDLNILTKKDDKIKKKLSEATGRKLMKVINFIYNLNKDSKGYKVNSLKK